MKIVGESGVETVPDAKLAELFRSQVA